jgi:cortexillin 1/2
LGLRNPGCSAEDIVDIDTRGIKLILGLLWTLYRKFRIAVITHQDKSSEEGLLLWCKNVTDGYAGVNIENFKQSFKDGLAFLALVHRFNPETTGVAFEKYSKDNPEQNLTAAFEFAEKELRIPKLLDVHEVMDGKVDERSLVLYTSLFFHAYTAAQVASDLEKARLSTEEVLAVERKRNEELQQINLELQGKIEQLSFQLKEKESKLEETQTVQLEFETKVTDLKLNISEYTSKISQLEAQIEQLNLIIKEKEEQNLGLVAASKKLEEQYSELSLKLTTHTKETEDLKLEAGQKQTEAENHITELKKKHVLFEEEIESLKNDIDNFKIQLDNERKDKEDQQRVLNERTEQDGVHRKGLGVLRRNLDQHIEDLHTWQKYLDSKDKTFLDFDREIRSGLLAELDGASDFVGELNVLSGKLEAENEAMLKILKGKLAEAKAAEIAKVASK